MIVLRLWRRSLHTSSIQIAHFYTRIKKKKKKKSLDKSSSSHVCRVAGVRLLPVRPAANLCVEGKRWPVAKSVVRVSPRVQDAGCDFFATGSRLTADEIIVVSNSGRDDRNLSCGLRKMDVPAER